MKKLIVLVSLVFSIFGSIVSYADEWKQDSTGWQYVLNDGSSLKDRWFEDPGTSQNYHFDSNGYMQSGVVTVEGKEYYFNESGMLQTSVVIPDGRMSSSTGEIFKDVNDGVTFLITWATDVKVGNGKAVLIAIKNICDKPITIKSNLKIVRNEKMKDLYLFNPDSHSFYEERTINPNEAVGMNFVAPNISEFYTDETSFIVIPVVIGNKEYSCYVYTRTKITLHESTERLNEIGSVINR